MIQTMMSQTVIIHRAQKLNKPFCKNLKKEVAEYQKINGKTEFKERLITQKLRAIQIIGTGET
jgi:hypothetical protein